MLMIHYLNFYAAYFETSCVFQGYKPLETPRRMWVDKIQIDLEEIERNGMNWIGLFLNRD
jgi:hypothetical protein